MKKVEDDIIVKQDVELFEIGDLICFTEKTTNKNYYGIVVEDQNKDDINTVCVYSIFTERIARWVGIHEDDEECTECKFVTHLENVKLPF